ncbi:unnamed protein product [Caenorhabditis bovis]|uniref:Uncharacterized protein n=1 Tax=Caenorhabditis bovis TaxID=2654633 RepID=A0A8S1E9L2_9PELO|nr:unnamed protein product [Caenorhabditis bovis]
MFGVHGHQTNDDAQTNHKYYSADINNVDSATHNSNSDDDTLDESPINDDTLDESSINDNSVNWYTSADYDDNPSNVYIACCCPPPYINWSPADESIPPASLCQEGFSRQLHCGDSTDEGSVVLFNVVKNQPFYNTSYLLGDTSLRTVTITCRRSERLWANSVNSRLIENIQCARPVLAGANIYTISSTA